MREQPPRNTDARNNAAETPPRLLLVALELVDAFFGRLKDREKDGVDEARTYHGDAKATVGSLFEEVDFWDVGDPTGGGEDTALVNTLGSVDWVDLGTSDRLACGKEDEISM